MIEKMENFLGEKKCRCSVFNVNFEDLRSLKLFFLYFDISIINKQQNIEFFAIQKPLNVYFVQLFIVY